jgi:PIN domain nuclease of toxin-antitoxin system
MRVLLDTHTFPWFVLGDTQLSASAKATIEDPRNEKLLSPASYWEIAIKISLGKYTLSKPYEEFMEKGITENGFGVLPIEPKHTAVVTTLPFHHRDPFDRLIIAQAMVEDAAIVSNDTAFDAYSVTRVW